MAPPSLPASNVSAGTVVAPSIQALARAFNNQNVTVGGHCVEVQVTGGQSASEAGQIDGQASLGGMTPIDAWIPDSTLWVDVARTYPLGAQDVQPTGKSVARSPLMLVTTAAVEAKTHVFEVPPSWSLLLPPSYGGPPANLGLAVDLPDPTDSASGLATLIEVTRELGDGPAARTAFTKFVFNAESTENFDSAAALQQFARDHGAAVRPARRDDRQRAGRDRLRPGQSQGAAGGPVPRRAPPPHSAARSWTIRTC